MVNVNLGQVRNEGRRDLLNVRVVVFHGTTLQHNDCMKTGEPDSAAYQPVSAAAS
jgi:hypothetical protein